jgi:hypothetical protein
MRLNIAAGTAVRFEPGQRRTVELVALAGARVGGRLPGPRERSPAAGRRPHDADLAPGLCRHVRPHHGRPHPPGRHRPVIEIERDYAVYGEEVKFGGGKVIRDGMGQSQLPHAQVMDTVVTNAVIVDHWGIVKADIGIKDGLIAGIGKAGNPDIQPGVTLAIGGATEIIAGEGMIVTAGGVDTHIHFICPQQIEEALASGITTMLGGGTGPAVGTAATTCTPGPGTSIRC